MSLIQETANIGHTQICLYTQVQRRYNFLLWKIENVYKIIEDAMQCINSKLFIYAWELLTIRLIFKNKGKRWKNWYQPLCAL